MKHLRTCSLFLLTVLIAGCGTHKTGQESSSAPSSISESVGTTVFLLVGISRSFAPLADQDRAALNVLTEAMMKLSGPTWDVPVRFFWSTFGAFGTNLQQPCGPTVTYNQRLIPGVAESHEITKPDVLRQWFSQCVDRIASTSQQPQSYTDISGAIAIAADSNRNAAGRKVMIIYSDFVESLPPGTNHTLYTLSGEEVVLIYRPEEADKKNENAFLARIRAWESSMKKAGAKSVRGYPVWGLDAANIVHSFQ